MNLKKGMSGGPVFYKRDDKCIIIGIHHGILKGNYVGCFMDRPKRHRILKSSRQYGTFEGLVTQKLNYLWCGLIILGWKQFSMLPNLIDKEKRRSIKKNRYAKKLINSFEKSPFSSESFLEDTSLMISGFDEVGYKKWVKNEYNRMVE